MQKETKEKLDEVVALLNDPDETVMDKEIIKKLEKILYVLKNPDELGKEQKALSEKMQKIVTLVDNAIIDVEVDVEYCIPGLETTTGTCDVNNNAYILLTYSEDEYTTRTRKISLGKTALQSSLEDLTKHVVLAIEEFKDEMDDIKMG
ncbi:hypothetical protein JHD50_02270 [Sulfurimonas sp. MAG313]|nr:hypothetical protein [Sulfurimonas sp. MAG313]MDF1880137.1 hypothetical protein [Sulfurimonas sp. MAG313]